MPSAHITLDSSIVINACKALKKNCSTYELDRAEEIQELAAYSLDRKIEINYAAFNLLKPHLPRPTTLSIGNSKR